MSAQPRFSESGLLHGPVIYYAPNQELGANVKDVRVIPFCKHESYRHQAEYRLALATRGGLSLTEQIVNELYSFDEDVAKGTDRKRHVFVGEIGDIVRVHERG